MKKKIGLVLMIVVAVALIADRLGFGPYRPCFPIIVGEGNLILL